MTGRGLGLVLVSPLGATRSRLSTFPIGDWLRDLDGISVDCKRNGWNSYNAKAVTNTALNAALCLCLSLEVTPLHNGGIQISFADESLSFELGADGLVTNVYADIAGSTDYTNANAKPIYGE